MKIIVNHYTDKRNDKNNYSVYTVYKTGKTYTFKLGEKHTEAFWYLMKCINRGYKILKSDLITDNDVIVCSAIYDTY